MRKVLLLSAILIFLAGSQALAADVSSVWAEREYYLIDGDTGIQYGPGEWEGTTTMNWKHGTRYGFYHTIAKLTRVDAKYEFILIGISNTTDDSIQGFWDIYKNGSLVCDGCVGEAYGIDLPVGTYFKLYVGDDAQCNDQKWHVSMWITNRLDY